MAWGKKSDSVIDDLPGEPGTLKKLQSTIILFVVLAVLAVVGYGCYKVAVGINDVVQEKLGNNKRVSIDSKGVNIKVKQRSHERTLDSAQRWAYKAWQNSKAPDEYDGPLKFRETEDKRQVNLANATADANAGWS